MGQSEWILDDSCGSLGFVKTALQSLRMGESMWAELDDQTEMENPRGRLGKDLKLSHTQSIIDSIALQYRLSPFHPSH